MLKRPEQIFYRLQLLTRGLQQFFFLSTPLRKAILLLVLFILIILPVSSVSFSQAPAAVSSTYRGDINEDGQVNIFDLLEMLKMLGSMEGKTERQRQIADVDANDAVNIFDLLGLLKVLSGAEESGIIYWGPSIANVSPRVAAVGDTLEISVENFEEGTTAADVKALLNTTESNILQFSLETVSMIVPEWFTGGEVALIVGADTTNSVYIGYLVKVIGTVEQVSGLELTTLKVVSPQAEDAVEADGSFDAKMSDSTTVSFVVAVNEAGSPMLLSFMTNLPETGLMGVKSSGGFTHLAATDGLSLGIESTALSLIMLNPALIGSSAEERSSFAERSLQHSRFQELVTGITNVLAADPNSNYLVDESHQELFQLANEIAVAVYDELVAEGQLQLAGITDRPDPGIQAAGGSKVEFTNPYYIYYGTGIYDYGQDRPKQCFAQKPRPFKWGFIPTFSVDDPGLTEETITPEESLTVEIAKGFNFDSQHWWNPSYPVGRGTLYNSGHIVLDVIELIAMKIPGSESILKELVEVLSEAVAINEIQEGFMTGNPHDVLSGFLTFIQLNHKDILKAIFESASKEEMSNYVSKLTSVLGTVFKVLTVVQKVPFYTDLFLAPGEVSYDIVMYGGQVYTVIASAIVGRVLLDGSGLGGVTVTLTGNGISMTTTTDSNGGYEFKGLEYGSYTVSFISDTYVFSPSPFIITANKAVMRPPNVKASIRSYVIVTGRVLLDGSGLGGVTVTLTGNGVSMTATSDSNGGYNFEKLDDGSYTVRFSSGSYTFSPGSVRITVSNEDVSVGDVAASLIVIPPSDTPPTPGETEVIQGITMVSIPGGTFQMGSNWEDDPNNPYRGQGTNSNEQPVHSVSLTGFQMSRYEITQEQYQVVMGINPSNYIGDLKQPVEGVSWYDAVRFCNTLSITAGFEACYDLTTWECDYKKNGFRLPTEAEWEYACRAGTTTKYYTGDSVSDLNRAGWYINNLPTEILSPVSVGEKEPNSFGLYDMHGNVSEWCNDWYYEAYYTTNHKDNPVGPLIGTEKVTRGGNTYMWPNSCTSSARWGTTPEAAGGALGFRVVRR